jgi:hypothetical protein
MRWSRRTAAVSGAVGVLAVLLLALLAGGAGGVMLPQRMPPWAAPVASYKTIHVAGSTIQIDFGPGKLDLPEERVLHWVQNELNLLRLTMAGFQL